MHKSEILLISTESQRKKALKDFRLSSKTCCTSSPFDQKVAAHCSASMMHSSYKQIWFIYDWRNDHSSNDSRHDEYMDRLQEAIEERM